MFAFLDADFGNILSQTDSCFFLEHTAQIGLAQIYFSCQCIQCELFVAVSSDVIADFEDDVWMLDLRQVEGLDDKTIDKETLLNKLEHFFEKKRSEYSYVRDSHTEFFRREGQIFIRKYA